LAEGKKKGSSGYETSLTYEKFRRCTAKYDSLNMSIIDVIKGEFKGFDVIFHLF